MTRKRTTILATRDVAKRFKKVADEHLVERRLDDARLERLWEDFYRAVAPTRGDVRRADAIFERLTRPKRRGVEPI